MTGRVGVIPVAGIGEVRAGDDLAELIAEACELEPDDIVVVTSKIVSKAEARAARRPKDELLAGETLRLVARRAGLSVVRTRLGLVMAGAGIDASNTEPGTSLLLPLDPDGSARRIRDGLRSRTGLRLGIVVSDTAGRAWRRGQTDIAIGAAGIVVADNHAGRVDPYGNQLAVTEPAIADELAAAADLVKQKLSRCPVAVIRGLPHLVVDEDGDGAASLIRAEDEDLFGLGARQAVLVAAGLEDVTASAFGEAESGESLSEFLARLGTPDASVRTAVHEGHVAVTVSGSHPHQIGRITALVDVVATACGWRSEWETASGASATARLRPA